MRWRVDAFLAAMVLAAGARALSAQDAAWTWARVTYVSGGSVYVDAGERDGLTVNAPLEVVRAGGVIARLQAQYLSPGRAQCQVLSATMTVQVGDSVRFTRSRAAVVADRDTAPAIAVMAAGPSRRRRANPLRGRLGLRYLASMERDSGRARLSQPATDVRLDGSIPGASSLEIALDARARRTSAVTIDGVSAPSRTATLVYQASLLWSGPAGSRLRVGRQYSPELSPVSLFDGVLAGVEGEHVAAGGFAGSQPDAATMRYSTKAREYGAFASVRARPANGTASLTAGAITAYDGAQVDRDFGYLSASWAHRAVSFVGTQEFDYNRGWRAALESSRVTPTSTWLSLHVRPTDAFSLRGGYDTRRNVRLYRNYTTPEISFDDTFRTGVWAGVHYDLLSRGSAYLDLRRSSGGRADTTSLAPSRPTSNVATLGLSAFEGGWVPIGIRSRASLFSSQVSSGWLASIAATGSPLERLHLEVSGGLRQDTPAPGTAAAAISDRRHVRWMQLDADIAMGRSWFVLLSLSTERGGWESSDQLYSAVTWRF